PAELSTWLGALAAAAVRVRSAPDLTDVTARTLRRIDVAGSIEDRISGRIDAARALASINVFDQAYQKLEEAYSFAGDRQDLRRKALGCETETAVREGDFSRAARAADEIERTG